MRRILLTCILLAGLQPDLTRAANADTEVKDQPNFILTSFVDEPNVTPFLALDPDAQLEDREMMFQLSIKAPIWHNMFGSDIDGYFGYTTKSYWQLFNDEFSAPFRETNYQPELLYLMYSG